MSDVKKKLIEYILENKEYQNTDGSLNKYKFINDVEEINPSLVSYLASIKDKKMFSLVFSKIDDMTVLNQNILIKIVNSKEYVKNSTTFYQNKIGLVNNGSDVVLDFPFKDCVLLGGMDKEDEKNKTEVFYHELLDKDKIDNLFSPKVFTNVERYGKSDDSNLIVKGNNLLGLHTLANRYKKKVKFIIADPPYFFSDQKNADSFSYNSNFKLSTWLTFMKNRLEIAKELLQEDGCIGITINSGGVFHLKILMDEIFNDGFLGDFQWRTRTGANDADNNFSIDHETVLFYCKDKMKLKFNGHEKNFDSYKNPDNDPRGDWFADNLRNPHEDEKQYGVLIDPETGDEYPGYWRISKNNYKQYIKEGRVLFPSYKNKLDPKSKSVTPSFKRFKSELRSTNKPFSSISVDYLTQHGSSDLKKVFDKKAFSYPKPKDLIKQFVKQLTNKKDKSIVLDFFAGSGTTGHAVLELNKEDGGNRKFILLEQMDYAKDLTAERIKRVIEQEKLDESFTYCELLKDSIKEDIKKCKKDSELINLVDSKFHEGYFQYIDSKEELLAILKEQKDIKVMKKVLIENYLDHNREYIPYSDIKSVKLDKKDLEFNKKFYGEDNE